MKHKVNCDHCGKITSSPHSFHVNYIYWCVDCIKKDRSYLGDLLCSSWTNEALDMHKKNNCGSLVWSKVTWPQIADIPKLKINGIRRIKCDLGINWKDY
jgi:hypothetical protein